MIRFYLQTILKKGVLSEQNQNLFRYVRSVARREVGPKFVEGKVKTLKEYDDTPDIKSYQDLVRSVKESELGDELEIEKAFLKEDYHGDAIERCDKFYEMHLSEEKTKKAIVKKNIIKRKYFKLDKETNLLTHAAKEQIHSLHKSNPTEWTFKALSECFPISEAGVKKLLKSNFVQTCPEKIKIHDEEVAKRWKILKSGKTTDLISPITQKFYQDGKLTDDYFSGNPNLPTRPASKKVIEVKREKKVGEFSAIVQTYVEHENQKLLTSSNETAVEKQASPGNCNVLDSSHKIDNKMIKKFKYASEEFDYDINPDIYSYRRRRNIDDSEIPFSQFKEILKDETSSKVKSHKKNEYDEFVLQETSITEKHISSKKSPAADCFLKIPKHEKDENVHIMHEKKNIYTYSEKLGYQHPVGKIITGRIKLAPKLSRKGKLHKVGQCVYDDNGEFLYKIPT